MAWPTTSDPRTEFVTIRLTTAEVTDLDAMASARSLSRSEAVRDALARVVAADAKRRATRTKTAKTPTAAKGVAAPNAGAGADD